VKNATGSSGEDCGWLDFIRYRDLTIYEAVDAAESPVRPQGFETGGDAEWFPQTKVYYYDNDAAQTGAIDHGQQTYLRTTVELGGDGSVAFKWKVSSELNKDFLSFYVDGNLIASISGEEDWQTVGVSLTPGTHTLEWIYVKDLFGTSGSDAGWIDRIRVIDLGDGPVRE
jgi:hypothetical protein